MSDQRKLSRNLTLIGAVAVSLAVVGPSMAISLNPQAMAQQVGGAVPVIYLAALVPISVIGFAFVILTRRHGTAGSVYGLVGVELGQRTGVAAGMWLLTTYCAFSALTASSFGIFMIGFVESVAHVQIAPVWTYPVMLLGLLIALGLAIRPVRIAGRVLLALEGLTMALIFITSVLVLVHLLRSGGPQGQTVNFSEFSLAGVKPEAIGLALTFAILSSSGFEGAASAGEETKNPLRNIPRAIMMTAVLVSCFYVFVSAVGVWAFGTAPNELHELIGTPSLPGDMADIYVARGLGDYITLGGALSSLACMTASQIAAGRIFYALGRDGVMPHQLGSLTRRWDTPAAGSAVTAVVALVIVMLAAIPTAGVPFSVFETASDFSGIMILAAYAATCVTAGVVLWRQGGRRRLLAGIPAIGVLVAIAVLWMSLFPLPSGWELVAPLAGVVCIIAGGVFAILRGDRAVTLTSGVTRTS